MYPGVPIADVPSAGNAERRAAAGMGRTTKRKPPGAKLRRRRFNGGDNGVRTHDLRLAKPALSQLSYVPDCAVTLF